MLLDEAARQSSDTMKVHGTGELRRMDVPRGAGSALPRGCLRPSTRGAAPRRAPSVLPTALAESSSEKSSEVGRRSVYLKNMTLAELEDYCEAELDEPRRRAAHVWTHMYGDNFLSRSLGGEEEGNGNDGENREFSGRFLDKMSERGVDVGAGLSLASSRTASDGTKKLVFRRDSEGGVGEVETVLIPVQGEGRKSRVTVCVSSQVGCAMGCKFCFTGLMGLEANLTAGEIVEQVVEAKRAQKGTPLPVTNIVYMGMGEPFDNYDEVVKVSGRGREAEAEKSVKELTPPLLLFSPFPSRSEY